MSELSEWQEPEKKNLLNLSLDATEAEREKSPALQMGYDQNTKRWELIIQYNGTVEKLQEQLPQAGFIHFLAATRLCGSLNRRWMIWQDYHRLSI